MREIKKVLICGLGAIGSIFADKISRFDNENLRILVDENRLEKYKKYPKIFNNKELNLNYILPANKDFEADLVLVATKYNALSEVVENLENFVGENTIIISILNGISTEEIIAQKYGWDNLPLAYFLGHSEVENNGKITYDGQGRVVFGAKENLTNPKIICEIENYFNKVGIKYNIPEDMLYAYWLKFMLNISTNQPSAILRTTFGEMTSNEKFMNLIKNIMTEVQTIAKAEGVKNTDKMIDEAFVALKRLVPNGKTSMLQDIEAKRVTEVEMFAKVMVEFGEKHDIPTPYNQVMWDMLEVIQEGYKILQK